MIRRFARLTVPLALLLATTVLTAVPASAESECVSDAAEDVYLGQDENDDPVLGAEPKADILAACITFTATELQVTVRIAQPHDPATDPDDCAADGDTASLAEPGVSTRATCCGLSASGDFAPFRICGCCAVDGRWSPSRTVPVGLRASPTRCRSDIAIGRCSSVFTGRVSMVVRAGGTSDADGLG